MGAKTSTLSFDHTHQLSDPKPFELNPWVHDTLMLKPSEVKASRCYNAKALVNKGNCLLIKGEFELSKQFYLEAIGVEADCVEAIYNLGLVNLKMAAYQEALQAFDKLHTIIPHNPEVRFFYKYFFCSTECVTALFNCICAKPFPGNLPDSKSIRANK